VDKKSKNGWTPLHLWSDSGNYEITRFLLGANASMNTLDDRGKTPLHLAKNEGVATLLLQSKAEVDKKSNTGLTALHCSCCDYRNEVSNLLVGAGASVNTSDPDGSTPLHILSEYGNYEVAKLLLGAKASVNTLDGEGKSPLDVARDSYEDSIVELFTERQ